MVAVPVEQPVGWLWLGAPESTCTALAGTSGPSGRGDPGHDQVHHPAGELVAQRPVALEQPVVRRAEQQVEHDVGVGARGDLAAGRQPAGPGPCCWPGGARTPAPATRPRGLGPVAPRRPARPASGPRGCGSPTGSSRAARRAGRHGRSRCPAVAAAARTRQGRRPARGRRGIPSGGRRWPCPPRPGPPPPPSTSRRGRARPAVPWPRPGWPGPPPRCAAGRACQARQARPGSVPAHFAPVEYVRPP